MIRKVTNNLVDTEEPVVLISSEPTALKYTVQLFGPIGASGDYLDLLELFHNARERDEIHVHIRSPGGSVEGATALVTAINETKATVFTRISSICASAATRIFLAGDYLVVGDYVQFMAHNYSSLIQGSGAAMQRQHEATTEWVHAFMLEPYETFLTPEEIQSIKDDDKEVFLIGKELIERLKASEKYRDKVICGRDANSTSARNLI